MSSIHPVNEIQYPESDGKPVGETDIHIEWIFRIRDILRQRYRRQHVYTAADLLLYYEEGNPKKFVVPDNFVVLDCEPGHRRTFRTWEEGKVPNVVFEVTSRSTRREDEETKPKSYARIGVNEYFLYDPTREYLAPSLQGFRLIDGQYVRIEADESGALVSEELGFLLRLSGDDLVLTDRATGGVLRTEAEAEAAARKAETTARKAAEQRAEELEAELDRLRDELKRRSDDHS